MIAIAFDSNWEAALDREIQAAMGDSALKAMPQPQEDRLTSITRGVIDTLAVGRIYLKGFEEIAAGGQLAQEVGAEVLQWVRQINRQTSGSRIAGILATNFCSALEGFIADVGDAFLTPNVIATIGTRRAVNQGYAKNRLLRAVKPSVKASGGDWLRPVKDVFDVQFSAEAEGSLLRLISFRNDFVHDPPTALLTPISGEEIKCWGLATQLATHHIALATA